VSVKNFRGCVKNFRGCLEFILFEEVGDGGKMRMYGNLNRLYLSLYRCNFLMKVRLVTMGMKR